MKRHAPAAERNRGPILEVLQRILPPRADILEIGSGTGQHADFFTERVPGWTWQPTDLSESALESIEAHRLSSNRASFLRAIRLDVREEEWPGGPYDAVFSANVIHIAPWPVCVALLEGASRVLRDRGVLVLYGPFRFGDEVMAPSNTAFDERLREENGEWGVRDVRDIDREGTARGFAEPDAIAMPANNHVLVLRRH